MLETNIAESKKCSRRFFGITKEQYITLFKYQDGACAICKKPETFVRHGKLTALAVDHCHVAKKIRGLLCCACNAKLVQIEDVVYREGALAYLVNPTASIFESPIYCPTERNKPANVKRVHRRDPKVKE